MNVDKTIAQLEDRLDQHRKNNVEAFLLKDRFARLSDSRIAQGNALLEGVIPEELEHLSDDKIAQGKALLAGIIGIQLELDQLKIDGSAAVNALLNRQDNADERSVSLVQGFVFGVQLMEALYELGDTDSGNKVADLVRDIVRKLDAIEPGGDNLAALLDHPDDLVRVYAGQYLIDRMPERVVPVLRLIEEKRKAAMQIYEQ